MGCALRRVVTDGLDGYFTWVDVVFLFMDESLDSDHAWLTGLMVPASQYPDVRDAFVRIAREALTAAGQTPTAPIELHGVDLLRNVPGATDEHRLDVFSKVVGLVNRERLACLSFGHAQARSTRRNFARLHLEFGEKLHNLNFHEIVDFLPLSADTLVVPVFDVVGRSAARKTTVRVESSVYDTFLLGGSVTHWNRIGEELHPSGVVQHKTNLRNLTEPTLSDSARSPLLQLTDIVGYLLGVAERCEHSQASHWKREVADVASGLDSELVYRRSVLMRFEGA